MVEKTTRSLDALNRQLTPLQPGSRSLIKNVMVQFNKNVDAYETGPHMATVSVDLLEVEKRNTRVDDIFNLWRKKMRGVPDIIALKFAEPSITPVVCRLKYALAVVT